MPTIDVYNLERKKVGTLDLAEEVFGGEVNEALLYDMVKAQLASRRSGSAKSKGRAEVAGSSQKIRKQKGTGGSRHGSIRAPSFVGGGKAHGPRPRDYSFSPNKKMRKGALCSALRQKLKEGRLIVVEDLNLKDHKTKALHTTLAKLQVESGSVLVDAKDNKNLSIGSRNLPNHLFLPPEGVNVYDLLRNDHLVLSRSALLQVQERCKAPRRPQVAGASASGEGAKS